jgi:hypothetical protein
METGRDEQRRNFAATGVECRRKLVRPAAQGVAQPARLLAARSRARSPHDERHLSFIESGRATPSRDMILRISGTLDIPLRQQNGVLLAAGYAPA